MGGGTRQWPNTADRYEICRYINRLVQKPIHRRFIMAVVTISRQTGSSGDEIAAQLAKNTGCELINDEKIHRLAESCDDDYKDACSAYEKETFGGILDRLAFDRPAYRSLFGALNLELASKDNVILMGRGVQVVLKQIPGIFHVRIVAPEEVRARTIAATKGLPEREAYEYVRSQDRRRRSLIQSIYNIDLNDFLLYDLVLNTTNFSVEAAADLLAQAIAHKARSSKAVLPAEKMRRMAFAGRMESVIRKKVDTIPYMGGVQVSSPAEGEVVLVGVVSSERDVERALRAAEAYPGVCQVTNNLRVISGI
jgi:cytidylate kinase